MSEFQMNIIGSYVYTYLKSFEELTKDPHNVSLENRCKSNLSSLTDILSVLLDKPIDPEHKFIGISTSLSKEEFVKNVREVVEAF